MTIREEIISYLNCYESSYYPNYEKLKKSLVHFVQPSLFEDKVVDEQSDKLDLWFEGIVNSLFYKPNNTMLVLEGKEDCIKWFEELLFDTQLYCDCCMSDLKPCLYESLIVQFDFEYQKQQKIIEEDNFIILEENAKNLIYPGTDKRLCSYCTTTNEWRYPQRKNVIVIKVEKIDWELYNSIDKTELWREIFYKFKP